MLNGLTIAVEGDTDFAVAYAICSWLDIKIARKFIAGGKTKLDPKLSGYNDDAQFRDWLVLRDLDHDGECAPDLLLSLMPSQSAYMTFRIPVRTIEAWLLADNQAFSKFFCVRISQIPIPPDTLNDPVQTVVNLCAQSTKRAIREDMVPRPGSGAKRGPAYTSRTIEFATNTWDPSRAARNSDSLERCIQALSAIKGSSTP